MSVIDGGIICDGPECKACTIIMVSGCSAACPPELDGWTTMLLPEDLRVSRHLCPVCQPLRFDAIRHQIFDFNPLAALVRRGLTLRIVAMYAERYPGFAQHRPSDSTAEKINQELFSERLTQLVEIDPAILNKLEMPVFTGDIIAASLIRKGLITARVTVDADAQKNYVVEHLITITAAGEAAKRALR